MGTKQELNLAMIRHIWHEIKRSVLKSIFIEFRNVCRFFMDCIELNKKFHRIHKILIELCTIINYEFSWISCI